MKLIKHLILVIAVTITLQKYSIAAAQFKEKIDEYQWLEQEFPAQVDKTVNRYHDNTPLHFAVMQHNRNDVEVLVAVGVNLNKQNDDGETPLAIALRVGNFTIMELLIKAGADVDIQDRYGSTSLLRAIATNKGQYLDIFINNSKNLNQTNCYGDSPLIFATHCGYLQNISSLLCSGANINIQDLNGDTALHIATRNKNLRIVTLLIKNHAHQNIKNKKEQTPFDLTTLWKKPSIFNPSLSDMYLSLKPPSLESIYNNNTEKIIKLLEPAHLIFDDVDLLTAEDLK